MQSQPLDVTTPAVTINTLDDLWVNSCDPKARRVLSPDELYGPTPYDINFCLPYHPKALETDQIKLVPFIPHLHAQAFFEHAMSYPEDFRHMLYEPPKTLIDVLEFFELKYRRNPASMAFAVVDKRTGAAGGIVTLSDCDAKNLRATISMGFAYRAYRGKTGAAVAAALLVRYCLNLPSDREAPGLGLRRVTWFSHPANTRSLMLARALGFRMESERRWVRTVIPSKTGNGRPIRSGDCCGLQGVDNIYMVVCFDDWEAGIKHAVTDAIATMRYNAKL